MTNTITSSEKSHPTKQISPGGHTWQTLKQLGMSFTTMDNGELAPPFQEKNISKSNKSTTRAELVVNPGLAEITGTNTNAKERAKVPVHG